MLEKIIASIIGGFIAIVIFICPFCVAGYLDTHYNMNGTISSISGENICVIDSAGEEWEFIGDGFKTGEKVKITFFTSCTDSTRYDDEINKIIKRKEQIN